MKDSESVNVEALDSDCLPQTCSRTYVKVKIRKQKGNAHLDSWQHNLGWGSAAQGMWDLLESQKSETIPDNAWHWVRGDFLRAL